MCVYNIQTGLIYESVTGRKKKRNNYIDRRVAEQRCQTSTSQSSLFRESRVARYRRRAAVVETHFLRASRDRIEAMPLSLYIRCRSDRGLSASRRSGGADSPCTDCTYMYNLLCNQLGSASRKNLPLSSITNFKNALSAFRSYIDVYNVTVYTLRRGLQ